MNLTQKELGELLGVTTTSICNWEKGRKKPTSENLYNLSKVLDADMNYLIGKDYYAVASDDEKYHFSMTKDEMRVIAELRKYPELYEKIVEDPNRVFEKIKSRIFNF